MWKVLLGLVLLFVLVVGGHHLYRKKGLSEGRALVVAVYAASVKGETLGSDQVVPECQAQLDEIASKFGTVERYTVEGTYGDWLGLSGLIVMRVQRSGSVELERVSFGNGRIWSARREEPEL